MTAAPIWSPTTRRTSRSLDPAWDVQPDGLCHCDPRPTSDAWGECPRCHRLDPDKSSARKART